MTGKRHDGGFWVAGDAQFLDLSGSYMAMFILLKFVHLQFMDFSVCMLNLNKNFTKEEKYAMYLKHLRKAKTLD